MSNPDVLSAAQRSEIRRLSTPGEPSPGDDAGELNVVPYLDIIMNIMMFVLASVSVAFASTVPISAAQAGPLPPGPAERALHLTALVTGGGVVLATSSGGIAPGCGGIGGGVTVPKRGGEHDFAALTACARRIKGSRADFAGETQVGITANPDVAYETVVAIMDALRGDESGALFPDVHLGVVR